MRRWLNHHFLASPLLVTLPLLSIGCLSTSAYAQSGPEFTWQVIAQLDTLTTRLQSNGYVEVTSYIDGVGLQENESRTWDLILEPNIEYVIAAVCDDDCQSIELTLLDNSTIVHEGHNETPYPMITGILDKARYQTTVTMGACHAPPCYSGLRVFRPQ